MRLCGQRLMSDGGDMISLRIRHQLSNKDEHRHSIGGAHWLSTPKKRACCAQLSIVEALNSRSKPNSA